MNKSILLERQISVNDEDWIITNFHKGDYHLNNIDDNRIKIIKFDSFYNRLEAGEIKLK